MSSFTCQLQAIKGVKFLGKGDTEEKEQVSNISKTKNFSGKHQQKI